MTSPAERLMLNVRNHDRVKSSDLDDHGLVVVAMTGRPRSYSLRALTGDSIDKDRALTLTIEPADVVVMVDRGAGYQWSAKETIRELGSDLYTTKQLWGALNHNIRGYEEPKVTYFLSKFEDDSRVTRIERMSDRLVRLHRLGLTSLIIHIADEYTLSEAFVLEVLQKDPNVDIIANISQWNHYSPVAAQTATDKGIRVFDHKGLYGALNFSREEIATYVATTDRA